MRSYKMDNITYFTDELTQVEFAIIAHDDGSFTSMTKADYEANTLPSNSSIPQAGE